MRIRSTVVYFPMAIAGAVQLPSDLMQYSSIASAAALADMIDFTDDEFRWTSIKLADPVLTQQPGREYMWVAVQFRAIIIGNTRYRIEPSLDLHITLGYWVASLDRQGLKLGSQAMWERQFLRARSTLLRAGPLSFDIKPNITVCRAGATIYTLMVHSPGGGTISSMAQSLNASGLSSSSAYRGMSPQRPGGAPCPVFHLSAYDIASE